MGRSSAVDQDFQKRAIDYVREVLQITKISPTKLARWAKVEPAAITKTLAGGAHKYTLTIRTIGRIAAATGIDFGPFLTLDAKRTASRGQPIMACVDQPALTDLLGFLHFLRAERGIDVPERHFETLRSLTTTEGRTS